MSIKYWQLEIDGIDKTGKDIIARYLENLTNYKFSINIRGVISQLAYNIRYDRKYMYNLSVINKNIVYILLDANNEDIEIRCKLTNEKEYSINKDRTIFNSIFNMLSEDGYICYKYNTSCDTPYNIAKDIIKKIQKLEDKK